MALNLKQRRYVETVLTGLPRLAEAVAAIPPEWQPAALQAAERSYLKAFRQAELPGPQTWVSSVMRRLRRRVREAEKEKLTKLYEQLSANEHGSALPFGQAHSFVPHQAALSEHQKNVGRELSADEQIQEHSFATHEPPSSEGQNAGGELSADEQIQEHSFTTQEVASSEEQKNIARETVKKDAVAPGMARIMIRVDEIFDDGRHPMRFKELKSQYEAATKCVGNVEQAFKDVSLAGLTKAPEVVQSITASIDGDVAKTSKVYEHISNLAEKMEQSNKAIKIVAKLHRAICMNEKAVEQSGREHR
jgi:hypothetical protein